MTRLNRSRPKWSVPLHGRTGFRPQVILDDAGRPAFAVIRSQDDQRLTGGRVPDDELSDEALYDRAVADDEESFPIAVVDRIVAGESPIRVYREYRRMTQKEA